MGGSCRIAPKDNLECEIWPANVKSSAEKQRCSAALQNHCDSLTNSYTHCAEGVARLQS